MNDLEIQEAIKNASLILCFGEYRKVFFVPMRLLFNNAVEAQPCANSKYLENGKTKAYSACIKDCRLATTKETKWYLQLQKRSKHILPF